MRRVAAKGVLGVIAIYYRMAERIDIIRERRRYTVSSMNKK